MASPGRPREHKKNSRVVLAVRVPKPLAARLKTESGRRLIASQLIVIRALERELDRLEKQKVTW